jgi:hypothetical protein
MFIKFLVGYIKKWQFCLSGKHEHEAIYGFPLLVESFITRNFCYSIKNLENYLKNEKICGM